MARFRWRSPLAPDSDTFAGWVYELRGQHASGVYLIRDAETAELLYVGESHSGRLFETMTRHFYHWHGRGAGPSYDAAHVEVAVIVAETPLDDPVTDQFSLIQELGPRDNVMDGHWLLERMFVRQRKGGAR